MTTSASPVDWNMVVIVGFSTCGGMFPDYATIAKKITDAFTSACPPLWSFVYGVPSMNNPAPGKKVKVVVSSASLYSRPDTTSPRLGFAQEGDVLNYLGTQGDLTQTDKGWIRNTQILPA